LNKYYKNIGYYFLTLVIFIALGFYYPYFSLFPTFPSVTGIVHLHTIILLLWVFTMIAQPLLIRYKKYNTHKIIGKATYVIVPLVILTCMAVMRQQYIEGIQQKQSSLQSLRSLFTSFTGILSIVTYYSLAIFYIHKGNVGFHMRYIICLFLEFIPPTFGRTLGYWLGLKQVYSHTIAVLAGAVIIGLLIVGDKRKGENYNPYILALALYFVFTTCWAALGFPL
jgi:hypothetical protein